jgi:hypothetical protein
VRWDPLTARRDISTTKRLSWLRNSNHDRCRANARTGSPGGGWVCCSLLCCCRAAVSLRKPQCNPESTGTLRALRAKTGPQKSKTNVAKTWRTRERSATLQAGVRSPSDRRSPSRRRAA